MQDNPGKVMIYQKKLTNLVTSSYFKYYPQS